MMMTPIHRTRSGMTRRILTYVALSFMVMFSLVPLLWGISTSLKPSREIFSIPPRWIPERITLDNYRTVLTESSIPRYFLNSLQVGGLTTFASLVLGGLAGYGFSRFHFRGARVALLFILISQMLPLIVIMIPIYFVMDRAGLLNTTVGLSIAHLLLTMPLVTWMTMGYFNSIPYELEEATKIDGCSQLGALVRIVLPLAAPGLAASAIYAFIMSWNEFILASVLTLSDASRTLPIGISEFSSMFRVDWGGTMAASTLISLPIIVIFLFLQRYFVSGLASGAVKG